MIDPVKAARDRIAMLLPDDPDEDLDTLADVLATFEGLVAVGQDPDMLPDALRALDRTTLTLVCALAVRELAGGPRLREVRP